MTKTREEEREREEKTNISLSSPLFLKTISGERLIPTCMRARLRFLCFRFPPGVHARAGVCARARVRAPGSSGWDCWLRGPPPNPSSSTISDIWTGRVTRPLVSSVPPICCLCSGGGQSQHCRRRGLPQARATMYHGRRAAPPLPHVTSLDEVGNHHIYDVLSPEVVRDLTCCWPLVHHTLFADELHQNPADFLPCDPCFICFARHCAQNEKLGCMVIVK